MQIVLFEPEIPPNTGNIARLCAATKTPLNLIEPLGFSLENRYLKRAGLDYWPNVEMHVWPNWQAFQEHFLATPSARLVLTSTKHRPSSKPFHTFDYTPYDALVFGPETRGLPEEIIAHSPFQIRIPMAPEAVRSINLSTCAGIVLYMALSRLGFPPQWL